MWSTQSCNLGLLRVLQVEVNSDFLPWCSFSYIANAYWGLLSIWREVKTSLKFRWEHAVSVIFSNAYLLKESTSFSQWRHCLLPGHPGRSRKMQLVNAESLSDGVAAVRVHFYFCRCVFWESVVNSGTLVFSEVCIGRGIDILYSSHPRIPKLLLCRLPGITGLTLSAVFLNIACKLEVMFMITAFFFCLLRKCQNVSLSAWKSPLGTARVHWTLDMNDWLLRKKLVFQADTDLTFIMLTKQRGANWR